MTTATTGGTVQGISASERAAARNRSLFIIAALIARASANPRSTRTSTVTAASQKVVFPSICHVSGEVRTRAKFSRPAHSPSPLPSWKRLTFRKLRKTLYMAGARKNATMTRSAGSTNKRPACRRRRLLTSSINGRLVSIVALSGKDGGDPLVQGSPPVLVERTSCPLSLHRWRPSRCRRPVQEYAVPRTRHRTAPWWQPTAPHC